MTDCIEKQLVDEIIELQEHAEMLTRAKVVRAVPGPPATDAELRDLDAGLGARGIQCPPSLRRLLSAYNGVENLYFAEHLSLRSTQAIVTRLDEDRDEWEDFEPVGAFVFMSGDTFGCASFNPDETDDDGEMPVLTINEQSSIGEYESLQEYLEDIKLTFEAVIRCHKADRASLADD